MVLNIFKGGVVRRGAADASLVDQSFELLVILAVGLATYAAFVPLDFVLLQAGLPGRQSLLMALNVAINVSLNLLLVPPLGIQGAALATACAWLLSGVTLNLASWRWLGLRGGIVLASLFNRPRD